MAADKPLLEVESNLAGTDVAIRFRGAVKRGNSGVFVCLQRAAPNRKRPFGLLSLELEGGRTPKRFPWMQECVWEIGMMNRIREVLGLQAKSTVAEMIGGKELYSWFGGSYFKSSSAGGIFNPSRQL